MTRYVEGNPITDLQVNLAAIYPALYEHAEKELKAAGRDIALAGDLVQEAVTCWLEVTRVESRAKAYMRGVIRKTVKRIDQPGKDVMTHSPESLNQIEEL